MSINNEQLMSPESEIWRQVLNIGYLENIQVERKSLSSTTAT